MPDTLKIAVENCIIPLQIGILEHEHHKTQQVRVDVWLECRTAPSFEDALASALEQSVNYRTLYDYLTQQLPRQPHVALAETLAESIIAYCFRNPNVAAAEVKVAKLETLGHGAVPAVLLRRERP